MAVMYINSTVKTGQFSHQQSSNHSCRELAFSDIRGGLTEKMWKARVLNDGHAGSAYAELYKKYSEDENRGNDKPHDYYCMRLAILDAVVKNPISVEVSVMFSRQNGHGPDISDVVNIIKVYDTVRVEYVADVDSWGLPSLHGIKLTGDILTFPAFFWAAKQYRMDSWSISPKQSHQRMNDMTPEQRLVIARYMLVSGDGPQDSLSQLRYDVNPSYMAERTKVFADLIDAYGGINPDDLL